MGKQSGVDDTQGGLEPVDARPGEGGKASSISAAPLEVAHLAVGEQHHEGSALAVVDGVELGTAFGAPDTSGNSPFFSRRFAVRCALRCVASIISRSGLGPLAGRTAR